MQELLRPVFSSPRSKGLRTQEELVAEVREQMEAMGTIATLCVELYESSEERLVGGVIFEDERHYRFVYEDGLLLPEEEKLVITPNSLDEIVTIRKARWQRKCLS